jgi:hypothetical protein
MEERESISSTTHSII